MGDPTWYNQDGAIRTLLAIFYDATLTEEAFRLWSLQTFVCLLAYDSVRVLIWLDHMGLRVATLVNLSFLGMDRLDARLARWLSPDATARYIPEAVKRFTTWAPLLVPFYIPRGADWDHAWRQAEALQRAGQADSLAATINSLGPQSSLLLAVVAVLAATFCFWAIRRLRLPGARRRPRSCRLNSAHYEVTVHENGEVRSHDTDRGYDVTRRSYDRLDPAGRTLFLVDTDVAPDAVGRSWPLVGNFPPETREPSVVERVGDRLRITNVTAGIRATVEISLPDPARAVELWTVTLEELAGRPRPLKLVPYLEWVLNRPQTDRGHTQYNRLFAEMQYWHETHAVLARDKHSSALGFLASSAAPEGFLTARIDFIGRARSLWSPRVLQTLAFTANQDTGAHPTLDPIASLLLDSRLPAGGRCDMQLLMGLAEDSTEAVELLLRHLGLPALNQPPGPERRKPLHRIGHGEILPGTRRPYWEFAADGQSLSVRTPFTPRPFDHTLANALGQVTVVTNRGLHTTSSVNSQQNRLTPDWPDTVTRELPGEAFYLYDLDRQRWYSPTHEPLRDADAEYETTFRVAGSATFHMRRDLLQTELTVFVPPDEPATIYRLRVRNHSTSTLRLRVAPYFQIVLADQPEHSGPLRITFHSDLNTLVFDNPRNRFRTGPAFVTLSERPQRVETRRGRFFGAGREVGHPWFVERGEPATEAVADARPIAALVATLEIPPGEEHTLTAILGQADTLQAALAVAARYQSTAAVGASLAHTQAWWAGLMDTVRVETNIAEWDHVLDWLKYQALAQRIWARRGFYQASGAFGYRDQLQDAVNLLWMEPRLARAQILLHAGQQFLEGDTVHWFHRLQDGRTGFVARTQASDTLLWLPWAVAEYVAATDDVSILGERTHYLATEQPLRPLPADKEGLGFDPLRSPRSDTVYRHAMKAIDLVLNHRMGAHGLPLMGAGDWNDGLDEIGSQGRGESVWLGFFLYYVLRRMAPLIASQAGPERRAAYLACAARLGEALEATWREDRYLRAIHDDGTEIGVRGSGVWEVDALTAAWAVLSGLNPERGQMAFDTALKILERDNVILLGWPPLREDTKPYLGRSSRYPEGVRENGMYCHGVQWLVGAARMLAENAHREIDPSRAAWYREQAFRVWLKISPLAHTTAGQIEIYGGQPNQQAADLVTTFDPGRMIWNGYTGAAGWMFRQALEGVIGARLVGDRSVLPADLNEPRGDLRVVHLVRDLSRSPLRVQPSLHETHPVDRVFPPRRTGEDLAGPS
jgi:cyclic beta-1,2-glucan synthetase